MNKLIFISFLVLFLCPTFILAADAVDVNTASLQQLDEITGIGPVLAQRIVDARPFSSLDDLLRVSGIGPKTLQKIKDQGLACINCQTALTQNVTPSPAPSTAPAPTSTPSPAPSPTPAPALIYPGGIFINEILPNPEGPDETDEWIELYNSNGSDVDLSGWQIQDTTGTVTTYTFPQGAKILADGFSVFKRPGTKIMLNNDQDGLNLLTPDAKIADSMSFTKAPLNQSYNKTASGWIWSSTLTPGAKNIITAIQAKIASKTLSKAKNSVKNNGTADISQSLNTNQDVPGGNETANPWFLFFTVLIITVILAAIVLLIKLKIFKKQHVRT